MPHATVRGGQGAADQGSASAQDRARQILAESETLTLSPRDWNAFFSALDNTDKPRPQLEAAAQDYVKWRNQPAPVK